MDTSKDDSAAVAVQSDPEPDAHIAAVGKLLKGAATHDENRDLVAGALVVEPLAPPRFNIATQRNEFLSYLHEHGYAVVADVADTTAITSAKSLMWDFLESVPNTQVRRDDVNTWGIQGDWLPSETNGILHGFGFGQSRFMWRLRLLPQVKAAFAAVWGTQDLIVSFDGGNAFRPWRHNRSWLTQGGWYHVDQNAAKQHGQGMVCVQGLVTLTDVSDDTGGLVIIPKSHTRHLEFCQRSKIARALGDFVPLPADDPILDLGARLVHARAGDLILWDSRTVHCNTPALTALHNRASESADDASARELIRQAGYVCMTPARFATQEVLRKRQDAFVNNISTSHWPHRFVAAGCALPDTPRNDPASISQEQRALIGYDRSMCTTS